MVGLGHGEWDVADGLEETAVVVPVDPFQDRDLDVVDAPLGAAAPDHLGLEQGTSRVQGPSPKTGNAHVRRLLVEAAWHPRSRYRHARPPTWPRPPRGHVVTRATGGFTSGG